MKWKANARKRPKIRTNPADVIVTLATGPIGKSNGKPIVLRTHTRDIVEEDESGQKTVVATMTFRQGQYIFPKAYLHPGKRFVGETKDARLTKRGWVVYLDAVLRDNSGHPVKVDGCQIDMSGWYLESKLRDANLGMELIRPGATAQSSAEIEASRVARIRKLQESA